MAKILLLVLFAFNMGGNLIAQVKIGNNPLSINIASLMELESTNKGFVLPRVSLTSINSTAPLDNSALNGTLVFNTNAALANGSGIYYWDSINVKWISVSPVTANGTTNYVAKWTSPTTIGTSNILYDDGTGVGINTTTLLNKLDVNGSVAVGTYAGTVSGPINGLIVSGRIGAGTSTPSSLTKLDVNGGYKLGTIGTVNKNIVEFSTTISNTTVPTGFSAVTLLGITLISFGTNNDFTDVTVTTPSTFSSVQGVVLVSPASGNDLPNGVCIASAKLSSTNQVKIRFVNTGTSSQTVSGSFNIMVSDF